MFNGFKSAFRNDFYIFLVFCIHATRKHQVKNEFEKYFSGSNISMNDKILCSVWPKAKITFSNIFHFMNIDIPVVLLLNNSKHYEFSISNGVFVPLLTSIDFFNPEVDMNESTTRTHTHTPSE